MYGDKGNSTFHIEARQTSFFGWCLIFFPISLFLLAFLVDYVEENYNLFRLLILSIITVIMIYKGVQIIKSKGKPILSVSISENGFNVTKHNKQSVKIPFNQVREVIWSKGYDASNEQISIEMINGERCDLDQFSSRELEQIFSNIGRHFDGETRKE